MLHLLAVLGIFVLIGVLFMSLPLILIGGLNWDDLRSVLLHHAYLSFTFEGDVMPGVRPGPGTWLVIRALSREDDARRALLTEAMATVEQRRRPRGGEVRLRLRVSTLVRQGSAMSLALERARGRNCPTLEARLRARWVLDSVESAW